MGVSIKNSIHSSRAK